MPPKHKPSRALTKSKVTGRSSRRRDRSVAVPVPATPNAAPQPESYVPSSGALLLARLYDGRARELWPAESVSDGDLARARELLNLLHYAYRNAIPLSGLPSTAATTLSQRCAEIRRRVASAINVLRGTPTTERERLLQYAEHMSRLVAAAREAEHDDVTRAAAAELGVYGLAQGFDPLFASVSGARMREALLSVAAGSKGGAGKHGSDHVAAELAVEANAFGAAKTGDFDRDVAAFKSRIRVERNKALNALARNMSPEE